MNREQLLQIIRENYSQIERLHEQGLNYPAAILTEVTERLENELYLMGGNEHTGT